MKRLSVETVKTNGWFENEVALSKAEYDEEIKNGATDNGYVWASIYLEIFLEGVLSMEPTPSIVEVNTPNGLFRLTVLEEDGDIKWLVRNDAFGCIAECDPKSIFEWVVNTYPDGIGSEGFHILAYMMLTTGCKDEVELKKVWDSTFYA